MFKLKLSAFDNKSANSGPPQRGWRTSLASSAMMGTMVAALALPSIGLAATIQGIKFNDTNGNGVYDEGEAGFASHVIQLIYKNADDSTGGRWNTRTQQDGSYKLENLISENGGGQYILVTSTPRDADGVKGCFTGELKKIQFNNTDIVNLPLAYQVPCQEEEPEPIEPAIEACNKPTIKTVKSGDWSDPEIWDGDRVPIYGDNVFIENGHEVIVDTPIDVQEIDFEEDSESLGEAIGGAICNAGTLKTKDGEFLNCAQPARPSDNIDIIAMYFVNYSTGVVMTGNGGNAPPGSGPKDGVQGWQACSGTKRCGEGQDAFAGDAGDILITATTIINDGLVKAGNGGNVGAAHATGESGEGGTVDLSASDPSSSSSMPLESGNGGSACVPAQGWLDWTGHHFTLGKPGEIIALIGQLKGEWDGMGGRVGRNVYYDPIFLKPSADFSMKKFNRIEIYTDEGGEIDFTQLAPGAISGKFIRVSTKSLNGKGGILDLTGIQGKLFVATEKVEIYADNIKTDAGINIRDLIDAPEVVIADGKIPYFFNVNSKSLVVGQPSSEIEIPVTVRNIASKVDSYNIEITDSLDWQYSASSSVTIEGYKTKDVTLNVTLPEKRGVYNKFTVTITSQNDPSVQKEVEIGVEVEAGADSDGDTYSDSLDAFPNDASEWLDSDSDGIGNNADTDDDNDGMLDVWEKQFESLSPALNDAEADPDNDGFTNLEENEANTDPSDPNSKPVKVVDVWVSDPHPDDGTEPGKATKIWRSPDIWVRNEDDGGNSYQNVKSGQDNYVYVNVRNRGTLLAKDTKVELYRSGASMGQSWPRGWALVGTGEVASLAPQASEIIKIKWEKDNIPKPGHYCFYARLLNDEDPMFALETTNMVQNTKINNNVAWRNFNVVGLLTKVTDKFALEVGNPTDVEALVKLVFDEPEKLLANDGAKAIVDLGETLFQRWQQAGGKGENIKALTGSEIELLATPAQLLGIPLKVGENLPITMRVDATQPMPGAGTSREYQFTAQEFINDKLIGGVDYAITTRAQDTDSDGDGIKDVEDNDNDNDGIPDDWEIANGLNPLGSEDAAEDLDGDGFTNLEEFTKGMNPTLENASYATSGIIRDELGNPIAGVVITIGDKTVTTDANGVWEITDLSEAEYTVTASKEGYTFPNQAVELGNEELKRIIDFGPISELKVMVSVEPRQPKLGENVTYTSTVMNGGTQTATNVVLTQTLPEGTTLVSLTAESGDCNKDTLTCTLPDLATGETAKVQLMVGNTEENKRLQMTATLTSNEYPTDVQVKRTSVTAYLSVATACSPKTIMPQGELNCTATVQLSEYAPSAATGVELTVTLPQGVELNSETLDERCVANTPTAFTCALADLSVEVGGVSQTVVNFSETLQDPGLLLLINQAQVTANEYPADTALARTKIYIPPEYQMDMALVVDVTNSMQEEMNGAKAGLIDFVNAVNARNAQFPLSVLIVFRDEVTVTAVTQDMDILIDAIGDMKASGGGMCPEASAEALEVAIRHVKPGGTIALVTDASPYDDADLVAITKALQDKAIEFDPFITGDCSDEESWNVLPNQP